MTARGGQITARGGHMTARGGQMSFRGMLLPALCVLQCVYQCPAPGLRSVLLPRAAACICLTVACVNARQERWPAQHASPRNAALRYCT